MESIMEVFKLKLIVNMPESEIVNPWSPSGFEVNELFVRAKTEQEARKIAQDKFNSVTGETKIYKLIPWRNKKYSVCIKMPKNDDGNVTLYKKQPGNIKSKKIIIIN